MPVFDQSVTRHVGLDTSNILTPSSISLTMCSLDRWKSFSSSSFHEKGVPGLRSWRNGSMWSAEAKAYDTWLTRPNQERISVMLQGLGKFWIASRYFLAGRTLSRVISNPAKVTVSAPNTNLSGLRMIPWRPQMSSHSIACQKEFSRSLDHRRVSSMHFVLLGMSATISSNRLVYASPDAMYPWGQPCSGIFPRG